MGAVPRGHQERDWTFGGTGEVTVNLFTLYVPQNGLRASARDGPSGHPDRGAPGGATMRRAAHCPPTGGRAATTNTATSEWTDS